MSLSLLDVLLAFCLGGVLGAWFYLGLFWTVRRLASARSPVGLAMFSLVLRIGVVVIGMIWLAQRHWLLPVIAVVSFLGGASEDQQFNLLIVRTKLSCFTY